MYQKKSKVNDMAVDKRLSGICEDLLDLNEDAVFLIAKRFVENGDKTLKSEISGLPVIISSIPLNKLTIPSSYSVTESNYLRTWCDDDPIIKLLYSEIKFSDGEINGKKITNLYLDFDDRELEKSKKYISS